MKIALYILCGLQFSGKTYLSKKIRSKINCKVISFDNIYSINKNRFKDQKGKNFNIWNEVKKIALKKLKKELKNGYSVIWDSTNPKKKYREELKDIAVKQGAESKIIYLDTPIEIIYKRMVINKKKLLRHTIKKKDFEKTIQEMEKPTHEETVYVYKPNSDLDSFLQKLMY